MRLPAIYILFALKNSLKWNIIHILILKSIKSMIWMVNLHKTSKMDWQNVKRGINMRIYKAEEVSKMLLEFSCSNHRSIKKKVNFSMIAGSDNTSEDLLKKFGNFRVLRSAIIYGANGSGKSNFISALLFMRDLVSSSINYQPGQEVFQARHKLCYWLNHA